MKVNPFKPNHPVPPGMFAGRLDDIEKLENALFQTKNDFPTNMLLTGERGIGKSSILLYLRSVANGSIESIKNGSFDFLVINLQISEKTTFQALVKLIENVISRELKKVESLRSLLAELWNFVQRVKVMDSGIDQKEREAEEDVILDELAASIATTVERITTLDKNPKDGICFILDEVDNSNTDLRIGYFLKTLSEMLQKMDCNKVCFLAAGLPDVINKIKKSHESAIRMFSIMPLKVMQGSDRTSVIDQAIDKGNEINEEKTSIDASAKSAISSLSEGYPNFIQQFGYSAFAYNKDDTITRDDVVSSAFGEGGALDEIGSRYYEADYFEKIKSDEYREVLNIMAEKLNEWITKATIREKFGGSETQLNNAINALIGRKIIIRNPSKKGEYRLQQQGFALWISLFSERKKKARRL